jgi:hypothetical protein
MRRFLMTGILGTMLTVTGSALAMARGYSGHGGFARAGVSRGGYSHGVVGHGVIGHGLVGRGVVGPGGFGHAGYGRGEFGRGDYRGFGAHDSGDYGRYGHSHGYWGASADWHR